MLELLLISTIVGKQQISPTVYQVDYLTPDSSIVTILTTEKK
jgi:hypothetical protein